MADFDFVSEFIAEASANSGDYAKTRNTGGFID